MVPPLARPESAADSIPVKHLHSSLNKIKYPVNVVLWTPEGRRLLTASSSGEFTLWNGMGFNFETIMQVCDIHILSPQFHKLTASTRHMILPSELLVGLTAMTGLFPQIKTAS